ncbi:hypothetical protein RHMOL_Rhmol05G0183300 [Rhododendron molle]|uniref:Uncharacterized protein n=1 Tax=Rhododendron molle TaxID=49168 RepID=A0ACC0NSX0_RHOML|nr:hypothetical protein RHMOL_Rhmol05G0183300 [Rhododendron molle]
MAARAWRLRFFCRKSTGFELGPLTVHKLSLILLITYLEKAAPMAARAWRLRFFCRRSTGFELGPLTVHKLSLILLITSSEKVAPMVARAWRLRFFCRRSTGFELGPLTVHLLPWLLRSAHVEMMHAVVEMGLEGEVGCQGKGIRLEEGESPIHTPSGGLTQGATAIIVSPKPGTMPLSLPQDAEAIFCVLRYRGALWIEDACGLVAKVKKKVSTIGGDMSYIRAHMSPMTGPGSVTSTCQLNTLHVF